MAHSLSLFSKTRLLQGLLILQLIAAIGLCVMLYLKREQYALTAYADGRRAIIDLASGDVSGNIILSDEETLTEEEYKRKRIEELTGKTVDSQNEEDSSEEEDTTDDTESDEGPDMQLAPRQTTTSEDSAPAFVPPSTIRRTPQKPLASAPLDSLQETLPSGNALPKIADDGTKPWEYYAKPYDLPAGTRPLSIVISNIGINQRVMPQVLQLDERITLAFSPYAPQLEASVLQARSNGFETWMVAPMQHTHYPIHDYGPLTMLEEEMPAENKRLLHMIMSKASGVVGFISTPNERFSRTQQMNDIYQEITRRGLLLTLYDKYFQPPRGAKQPVLHARPHIDSASLPASMDTLWRDIEAYTISNGSAVVTLSPMPAVMDELDDWIAQLEAKNIALVPLSAHVSYKE